ncbi:hypothetical protein DL93DRAFT_1117073 [Clavulina sp. PMI_390]|nr:hypothetical protein DL93DRAFT_1117073 [Clavulina sp. PMI_390]
MVNLAAEWLTLLLLESFYQSEQLQRSQRQPPPADTASPPYAAGASQSQEPSQSPPNTRSSKFHHNRQDSGSNHTPEYLQKQRDREDLFRRLCSLANTECVSRANHALALVAGYDKLFGLRNTNVTMVQIIYQVGETLLRGVVSGLRTGAGERAMAAGAKAREKVHECIKWLKIVGETYKSGTDSARNLELALEQTIKDGEQKRAQEEKRKKAVAEAKRRVAEKNANDALEDFDFEGMEHNNEDVERVLEAIQSSQGSSQPSEPVPPLFAPPPGPPPHWADTNPIVADPTIGLPSDAELMALLQNSSYEDTSPIGTFMTASGTQDLFASWLANAGLSASLTAGTAMSAKGIPTLPASISMAHAQGQTSTSPPPLSTTPALRIKGPAVHARPMEYPPQRPNPISSLLDLAVAEAASDSDYRTGGGGGYGSQLNVPANGTGYLSDTGYISAGGVAPAGVLPSADRQVSISPTSPTTMTSAMSMAAKAIPIPMPSGKSNLPVRRGRSSLSNLSPIVPTTSNATAASMSARYQPYGQKNRATANPHHPRGVAALRADSVFRVDDSDGGLSTGFTDG